MTKESHCMTLFVHQEMETKQIDKANDIRNDSYRKTALTSFLQSIVISNFLTFSMLWLHLVQCIQLIIGCIYCRI